MKGKNQTQSVTPGYHYNLDLPDELSTIIEQDFWMLEEVGPEMLRAWTEPVKFASTTWIIMNQGHVKVDINLISYEMQAPQLITIRSTQIMSPKFISPDFKASVIVMSQRFLENLFLFLNNTPLYSLWNRHAVVAIPADTHPLYKDFMKTLRRIMSDTKNPYASQALLFEVVSFFFKTIYKCYEPFNNEIMSKQGRMSDRFLMLVQEHYRTERFLDFYAEKLGVTSKHLSRTVRAQTGYTAVQWIERFVILDAKVLLKSSNLNIQQISDELNFPSQSFFGKYFKKLTGMSPKEFRNS